jgi:flavin-dependent dehydrogenase
MDKTELYDVIIVGGGPAGLAVGSELSQSHKVLLIEKGQAGKTLKSWFVPLDVVDEKVMPYTFDGVTRFMTKTFGGANVTWKAELYDRYPYINEKTLLPHWLDVLRENGAEVIDRCAYIDSAVNEGIVTVDTTSGLFQCRLLIDASGSDSPIVQKYGIDRHHYYWWSVFGCIGEHPNGLNGMEVGDYMLWQTFRDSNVDPDASMASGRPVFEYEILDEKTSFSFVFYLRNERVPREVMEREYMTVIRNEPTTVDFHDLKIRELKYGWYPSGALSQQLSDDHVVFIGDAGCWTTPCGWGMTYILRNYRYFAGRVSSLLLENRLDKKSLGSVAHYKTHEKFEVLLDAIVTHFLSNATAGQLDRFINLFGKIPKILCEKVFTLTVTRSEVHVMLKAMLAEFELLELARILTKEDYLLMLEEIKYFAEDVLVQKMHDVFSLFHKETPTSEMNDGFDFG